MAKYDVVYACGHVGEVGLVGKADHRRWRLEQEAEKLCLDCSEIERQRQNAEAADQNSAAGMAPLKGTPKQVAWAESIRHAARNTIEKLKAAGHPAQLFADVSEASWWIDHREYIWDTVQMREHLRSLEKASVVAKSNTAPEAVAASIEATVRPTSPVTETVAEIAIRGQVVAVMFGEKRADFITHMKAMGYSWTGREWQREVTASSGPASDRAAEVGHALLSRGYVIRIHDVLAREKAISGGFQPEQTKWVRVRTTGEYRNYFSIKWGKEDLYSSAKRLPGSRWDTNCVVVPPEQYEQVLDFARVHGFSVTDGALALAAAYDEAKKAHLVVSVASKKSEAPAKSGMPTMPVPEEVAIDDELRDNHVANGASASRD